MSTPLKALIVEDSEDDAVLLVRELRRGGYDVTFERVDSAESMSQALQKSWDIVFGDYSMPHFLGTAALNLLRGYNAEIPFIFVSGTLGEETAIASLKSGAQDYIIKGKLGRLLPAVQRELNEVEQRRQHKILERKLQHLERFEAIGRLAGGVAHDFNNVVAVILGLAQLGYEEAQDQGKAKDRFLRIADQADRAGKLTAQLLAFARRQVLQPQDLNLNTLIQRLLNFLHCAIGDSIDLRLTLAPGLRITTADPIQIEQVVMNLCLNARDAMPNGGRLLLQTENVELSDEFCNAHTYGTPGSFILLTVSDTGTGIDPETAEHIFEPFFTTKEAGRGTGLGLSTVYGVVKQHGGFINLYSEPQQGSTFRIYLPVAAGDLSVPVHGEQAHPSMRGTETILVAEDNEALRELALEVLTPFGYKVILAADGKEGLQKFEEHADDIKILVLDMVMPFLGGGELYGRISAVKPKIPVIFTTGHTVESASLQQHLAEGAVFLAKPYAPDALRRIVRQTLDSSNHSLGAHPS